MIMKTNMNEMIMNGLKGLASGFDKLDAATNGWQNGNLIVVAGRPAMGKTAFALSLVRNMAIEKKIPLAMFSLEMSKVQLVNRLIANVSKVSIERIRSGQIAKNDWSKIETGVSSMLGAPLYVDDSPSLSVSDLRVKAGKLVHEYGVKMSPLRLRYRAEELGVDVALFGHTHWVFYENLNGIIYLNPGSVGSPPFDIPAQWLKIYF